MNQGRTLDWVENTENADAERKQKSLNTRILHLDDTVHTVQLPHNASGADLYVQVIRRFNILESDYFDLEFVNEDGIRCWLDHTRPLIRQITHGKDFVFRFCVKFYTPHPNLLEEEYTRSLNNRNSVQTVAFEGDSIAFFLTKFVCFEKIINPYEYLFALQIKRDLVTGVLICSENTSALLASYIVQAEIGDFIKEEYHDISYLRPLKLLHEPNDDRLHRIMEFHKSHIGMPPTEADFALLDTARKVEFYGVRLHPSRDREGLPLSLTVTHLGLSVFQNLTKINTFSWAKIRKLSFKRKRFLIKLHSVDYDVIEFFFDSRDECKRFWKKCIEHHAFFRCSLQERSRRKRPHVVTIGSSFRYIGRTQKELIRFMRENKIRRPPFERPSIARRAHPTVLTGPHYASARMGTMSMTLRSKSADRRQFSGSLGYDADSSLLHGILGSSRFLEQSHLKRAHSTFVPSAVAMAQSTGAVATSGYSTMGGSSSGGAPAQSNEAANEDDDDDNASLNGQDMIASRFTTGSGQAMSGSSFEEKNTQVVSRSTADLPFTSASYFGWEPGMGEQVGQATVAVVTSVMSGGMQTQEAGERDQSVPQAGDKIEGPPGPAASVPPAVLAASPRATSVGPISKEGPDNQYTERAPPKPLRTSTNLARRQTLAGREIEVQKQLRDLIVGSLLKRQASLAENPHYYQSGLQGRQLSSSTIGNRMLETTNGDRYPSSQTNKVSTSQADQAVIAGDSRMTASSCIDSTEAFRSELDSSSTTVASKSYGTSGNTNESYLPTQESTETDGKQPFKQLDSVHDLKHAFSVDIRRSSMSTNADLVKACRCQSASTQTIQVDSTGCGSARDQPRGNQSPVSPNPGRADRPYRDASGGTSNPTTPGAPPPIDQTSIFEADGVTQIVGIDQWSSSGTESTTGVILRSTGTNNNRVEEEQQASWSSPKPEHSHDGPSEVVALPPDATQPPLTRPSPAYGAHHHPHHAAGCPRRDNQPEQTETVTAAEEMQSTVAIDPLRTTSSHRQYQQPLPVLPVDTLPVRPTYVREGEVHLQSYAYGFSRSIPAGVHLAGLTDPPPGEPQRMLPQYWLMRDRRGDPVYPCQQDAYPLGLVPQLPPERHNEPTHDYFAEAPCLYMHPSRLQDLKPCPPVVMPAPPYMHHHSKPLGAEKRGIDAGSSGYLEGGHSRHHHRHHASGSQEPCCYMPSGHHKTHRCMYPEQAYAHGFVAPPLPPDMKHTMAYGHPLPNPPPEGSRQHRKRASRPYRAAAGPEEVGEERHSKGKDSDADKRVGLGARSRPKSSVHPLSSAVVDPVAAPSVPNQHHHSHDGHRHRSAKNITTDNTSVGLCKMHAAVNRQAEKTTVGCPSGVSGARETHAKPSYEGRAAGLDVEEKTVPPRRHGKSTGQSEDQYAEAQWSSRPRATDESSSHVLHRGPPGSRQRQNLVPMEKSAESNRLKRKLVQSPSLGEKEETKTTTTQGRYTDEASGGQRTTSARTAPTSVEKGYVPPAPKDFLEKMEEHKASIEALRRELRSVETASAIHGRGLASVHKPVKKETSRPSTGPSATRVGGKTEAQVTTTAAMPSDEAAARLAGSSSSLIGFKDITSVGSSSGQQQRPHMTAPGPTGDEGLLIPPQDTLYLESDTASSLERVSTVRRSPLPLSGAAQPKTTLVSGEPDRARDATRSDQMEKNDAAAARLSTSPSPSLSGSSASYHRCQSLTQSLFSQGAILSNASSISRHSSSSSVPLSALSGCSLSTEEVEYSGRRGRRRSGSTYSSSASSSSAAKSSSPSMRMRHPYHVRSCRDCQQPMEELSIEDDAFERSHVSHRSHSHGVLRRSKEHGHNYGYSGHRQHHHSVPRPVKERSSSRPSHAQPSGRHHRSERDFRLHDCQCRGCRAFSARSPERSHRHKSDKGHRRETSMLATTSTVDSSAVEREELKKSRNQITDINDASLLKSILTDELALETIGRQQKLLKRELAKQRQLAAELAEAKRQTQRLLAEKARLERLQAELPSRVNVTETQISNPTTCESTTPVEMTPVILSKPSLSTEAKKVGEKEETKLSDITSGITQSEPAKVTKEEKAEGPKPDSIIEEGKLEERGKDDAEKSTARSDRTESVRSQRSHHSSHSHSRPHRHHHHHHHHHHKHHHRQQSRGSSTREEDQGAASFSGEDEPNSRDLQKREAKQEPECKRAPNVSSREMEEESRVEGEHSSSRPHRHHHRRTHHRPRGGSSEEDSCIGAAKSDRLSTSSRGERKTEKTKETSAEMLSKKEKGEKQKQKPKKETPAPVRSGIESQESAIKESEQSKSIEDGKYLKSSNSKTNEHKLATKLFEDTSTNNLIISNPTTNSPEHIRAGKPSNLFLGRTEEMASEKIKTYALQQAPQEVQFSTQDSHQPSRTDQIRPQEQTQSDFVVETDKTTKQQTMESELPAKKESPSSSPNDLSTDRQAQHEGSSQAPLRSSEEPDTAKIPVTTCQISEASAAKPITTTVHGLATSIISEVWAQMQDKRGSEASSPSSASSSSSSSSIILLPRASNGSPSGNLFMPPMTTEEPFRDRAEGVSLRHDLVEISCLEPVPEGRIAESYAATRFDRPFTCFSSGVRTPSGLHSPSSQPPQISTFISSKQSSATTLSSTTTLTTAFSTGTEISRPGEEEEIAEDTAGVDGSDSDLDSSTSSASEGSEEIEPFPLPPPPDLLAIRTSYSLGRELHEVVEEESGSICELRTAVFVAPLKPVAPLRVSRAITVPHVIAAIAGKTTPADASVTRKSASIADTVAPETPVSQATSDSKKEEEQATSAEQEPSKSRGALSTEASVESISSLPLPPDMPPPAEEEDEEEEAREGGEAEFGEQVLTTQPSRKRSRRKRSRHTRRSSGSKPVTGADEPSLV